MDKTHFGGLFLQILGILLHFNLGGFSLYVFFFLFRKEPFKYLGDFWIHSTAPRYEHTKTYVPRVEISDISDFSWKVRGMKTFFREQIWSCDRHDTLNESQDYLLRSNEIVGQLFQEKWKEGSIDFRTNLIDSLSKTQELSDNRKKYLRL